LYICYVDESGHAGTEYLAEQPVEVLCGVLTNLTKLTKTQREHLAKLDALQVPELKAKDAYRGRKDWAGVPPASRDAVFDEVLGWAVERSCKFIISPIDAKLFYERKTNGCPLAARFQYPWEAGVFNILLGIQAHQRAKPNNKGRTLVICDELSQHSDRLLDLFEGDLSFTDGYLGYKPKKTMTPRLDQIIDVPHFARSHQAVLIQIADWAAYVLQAHLVLSSYGGEEKYAGEAAKLGGWAQKIVSAAISRRATCPKGKDPLSSFFNSEVRPQGWPPMGHAA